MAKLRFKWGIASILTVGTVLVVVSVVALVTLLDIRRERALFRDELGQRALFVADILNDVLADPLYFTT